MEVIALSVFMTSIYLFISLFQSNSSNKKQSTFSPDSSYKEKVSDFFLLKLATRLRARVQC